MTKSMRNTLKSVAVMAVISAVAVALLALANAFFPAYKATLDAETADLIAGLVGLDVSGEEAISGGYIEMEETDEDTLAAFNDANGVDSSNKVLAAYRIAKGDAAGMHVVESQAQGYGGNPVIIVLTSFDSDNRIGSVAVKQQRENPVGSNNIFTDGYFEAFLEYVQGKTAVSSGEITSTTGATNTASINGLANAVNIAALYAAETYGGGLPEAVPEAVTDENLLAALRSVSSGTSFTSYPVSSEYRQTVYGVYTERYGRNSRSRPRQRLRRRAGAYRDDGRSRRGGQNRHSGRKRVSGGRFGAGQGLRTDRRESDGHIAGQDAGRAHRRRQRADRDHRRDAGRNGAGHQSRRGRRAGILSAGRRIYRRFRGGVTWTETN